MLCGKSGTTDVVDGHVSLLAGDRDIVLTSEPDDMRRLLQSRGCRATVRPC